MFSLIRRPSLLALFILFSVVLAACNTGIQSTSNVAQLPAGMAYAEGKEIYFTHTEASDPAIAETLTNMMNSPVLYVPSLAQVPAESLAQVYVFENGLTGKGPLGFQADVFNNPPGSEGYSPLRAVILVKWADGATARELRSETEVLQAEADGEVTITQSGVVVNMPFIVWDGGKR
ncbi:MAG TPA: hypothetical protein VIO36_16430 [Anaerolineaceae bacterium]